MNRNMHLIAMKSNGQYAHVNLPVPDAFEYCTGEIHGEFQEHNTYGKLPGVANEVKLALDAINMFLQAGKKIEAIKYVRMYTVYQTGSKWHLKESKDYVEQHMIENGYSL